MFTWVLEIKYSENPGKMAGEIGKILVKLSNKMTVEEYNSSKVADVAIFSWALGLQTY